VIIGAGLSGMRARQRLSEGPATRVMLIEAGGRDLGATGTRDPYAGGLAKFKLLDHPETDLGLQGRADPGRQRARIIYQRGAGVYWGGTAQPSTG